MKKNDLIKTEGGIYRIVEKFFDLVQNSYKDLLKGKGVIMPDYQERGSHDYRKDAVLTMQEFERIVVRCIVHYNCDRVIQNYPYSTEMLDNGVLPYANTIWNWKKNEAGATLNEGIGMVYSEIYVKRIRKLCKERGIAINKLAVMSDVKQFYVSVT